MVRQRRRQMNQAGRQRAPRYERSCSWGIVGPAVIVIAALCSAGWYAVLSTPALRSTMTVMDVPPSNLVPKAPRVVVPETPRVVHEFVHDTNCKSRIVLKRQDPSITRSLKLFCKESSLNLTMSMPSCYGKVVDCTENHSFGYGI